MKTIAITLDEAMVTLVDRTLAGSSRWKSRSALIRGALEDFLARLRREAEEERERRILRRHRDRLLRQAAALVREQARP